MFDNWTNAQLIAWQNQLQRLIDLISKELRKRIQS